MSASELQDQLISKIQIKTDEDILEGVLRFLEFETAKEVHNFTEDEKEAVNKARQQVVNGEYYTDAEVDNLTEKWLRK